MDVVAIIPARYASTRFPGKPLANKTGKYLIQHVYECVIAARRIGRCLVATDDERIADAVRSFGGEVAMTRADHASGTDRITEVVRGQPGEPGDIIVNVQGDEPDIDPDHLDRLIERLEAEPQCPVGTLACPFSPPADPRDPNCVKVVRNQAGQALYFSRSLIPYARDAGGELTPSHWLLHLGVYAYCRAFLLEFASWAPSPLECMEKLEQLRVLDHGRLMAVEVVEQAGTGVDTPEDYERFVARWRARRPQP
ncbi:MAG: 3-deoxy-manno-octulosonate cytidylyltransferase [Phycisphaerae bacterium]|jgi:3-deoxy-manno-octulosonate cytidylyltransferase (CMP-KDO synthetase)